MRLEVVAQPADGRGRAARLEAVDELGDFLGTQRIRADRVALDGRPDVLELVELRADRQIIAEHPRMVDRPDRAEGDGPLQGGQGNIPVIDGQQAEIVTHRPTPSRGFQRKQPSLARVGRGERSALDAPARSTAETCDRKPVSR